MIQNASPCVAPSRASSLLGLTSALLMVSLAVSCNKCVVRGSVVDMKGEPVPGVAVGTEASGTHALTNEWGQYRLSATPGHLTLEFFKSGYTTGHLALDVNEPRGVSANPVSLWCLPSNTGVYLVENWKYVLAAPSEPKPYTSSEKGLVYGIARLPQMSRTEAREPVIVLYNLPSFDVKVCRLHQVQASLLDSPGESQTVWTQEAALGARLRPIDEPEQTLWEAGLIEPLDPGVYAIHWGAFQGQATNELRVFLFSVYDPSKPEEDPAQVQPQAEEKPQKEKEARSEPEEDEADAEAPSTEEDGSGF